MDSSEDLDYLLDVDSLRVSEVGGCFQVAGEVLRDKGFVLHLDDGVEMQIHELRVEDVATGEDVDCFALVRRVLDLLGHARQLAQNRGVAQELGPGLRKLEEKRTVLVEHLGHEGLLRVVLVQLDNKLLAVVVEVLGAQQVQTLEHVLVLERVEQFGHQGGQRRQRVAVLAAEERRLPRVNLLVDI